ncbi:MAG TPA: glycosyltransferase family 4 protein [Devosia sp.]|nr:glycosyltransferase family 4 protein [Devosia sp.]
MADDQTLRILQILRAPVGGLFRHVRDLTEELARRGHAIGVIADSLTSDALTAERLDGLKPFASLGVHTMPMPRTLGFADFTTPYRIRKLGRALQVDVVHGHGAKGGLGARFGRTRGQVALNTPHGGVLNYKPGSLAGQFFRNAERSIGPITDAYIFESAYAQRAFHEQVGKPPCREAVIHNGLREEEFEPVLLDPDAKDFVFIGEFRDIKGIRFLMEALGNLRRPDGRPATIAMAGGGAEFELWQRHIAEHNLSDRVELLGVRPAREALRRGNVLVVPSLAESLPYVILEGTAAGRQVISTTVGGIAEIFGPTAGSLVPPADASALAAAMQRALDDPAGAQGEAAQRLAYVGPRFSVAHMTDRIETLYREALAARRS